MRYDDDYGYARVLQEERERAGTGAAAAAELEDHQQPNIGHAQKNL